MTPNKTLHLQRRSRARPGRTVAAGVILVAVVAAGAILSMFLGGGGKGDGSGEGQGPANAPGVAADRRESDTQTASATLPSESPATPLAPQAHQRPLRVVIRGSQYFVGEQETTLAAVKDLAAKVPEGGGPAVLIEPDQTSRARAEEELKKSLSDAKIRFAVED